MLLGAHTHVLSDRTFELALYVCVGLPLVSQSLKLVILSLSLKCPLFFMEEVMQRKLSYLLDRCFQSTLVSL